MSRVSKAISDELLNFCQRELKKQGRRGENARRLQAIISAKKYGISEVAKIYNISRETLMRWISKVKTGGVGNFAVAPGRGRPSKLTKEQQLELQSYIEKQGAQLTTKKVQFFIKERFSIEISKATAHRFCKRLGFSYITPRPSHYKKSHSNQIEFKKKS